jgi:hypothetical protein
MDRRCRTERTRPDDETARIRRTFGKIQKIAADLRKLPDLIQRDGTNPLDVLALAGSVKAFVVRRLSITEIHYVFPKDENLFACLQSLTMVLSDVEFDAQADALGGRLDRAHVFGECIVPHLRTISGYAHKAINHPAIREWIPTLLAGVAAGGIQWTEDGECLFRANPSAVPPRKRRGRPPRAPERVEEVMRLLEDGKSQDEVAVTLGYSSRTTISKIKKSHSSDSVK